jgi:hypothetical protein
MCGRGLRGVAANLSRDRGGSIDILDDFIPRGKGIICSWVNPTCEYMQDEVCEGKLAPMHCQACPACILVTAQRENSRTTRSLALA